MAQNQDQTQTLPPVVDDFLRYARTQPLPVQIGTLAAGNSGGQATSFLAWNPNNIPEVPAWCSELDLIITLPVTLTLQAGQSARLSPFAPYSAFSMQMLLAGSPEWPSNMSLVPFWIDDITHHRAYDPMGIGPVTVADIGGNVDQITSWFDRGPSPVTFAAGATTVLPGNTVTNGGGAPANTNFTIQFVCKVRFQRKLTKMWGMVPLGDPQNRPVLRLQLNSLVGPNPENNLIQDVAAGGATAVVGAGGVTCQAIFRSKSLDILPPGLQLGVPRVDFGLNVTYDNSLQIQNAGALVWQAHRTAQIYTAIQHLLVNNANSLDADYFGLWLTQNQQSARWAYDASAGTMADYFFENFNRYNRYLPRGLFLADFEGGKFPEIPRETPHNALMSPDVAYAQAAGIAPTPNMATAFRIPAGTVITNAYVATYTFGLVKVPY